MSGDVFVLVLCAALIHNAWNAVIKADADRFCLLKTLSIVEIGLSLTLIPFVAVPAADAWPYLMASATVNIGHVLFLNQAYRSGDLSHAYPLARGIAPLIVAVVSTIFLGEQLSRTAQAAVLLIGLGVTSLSVTRGIDGLRNLRMVGFALGTGGFVAAYTLIDGVGARAAGSPHGYMVWVSLVSCVLLLPVLAATRKTNRAAVDRRTRTIGLLTGLLSYFSAWVVIWAMTKAPIALVSALRETSIVFAVAIGVVFLKERLNLARLLSIATTLVGAAILKVSR